MLSDEEILARSRWLFVERGYAARTQQIAAAVGLTWGAIALRFGNKRNLFALAMAGPAVPSCKQEDMADLPSLLAHLSTHLWVRWPSRLQVRLAALESGPDSEADDLVVGLATVLERHARHGTIRRDLSAVSLARVVLALMTGDVAQRFVAKGRTLKADPAFIDSVVRLLSAH